MGHTLASRRVEGCAFIYLYVWMTEAASFTFQGTKTIEYFFMNIFLKQTLQIGSVCRSGSTQDSHVWPQVTAATALPSFVVREQYLKDWVAWSHLDDNGVDCILIHFLWLSPTLFLWHCAPSLLNPQSTGGPGFDALASPWIGLNLVRTQWCPGCIEVPKDPCFGGKPSWLPASGSTSARRLWASSFHLCGFSASCPHHALLWCFWQSMWLQWSWLKYYNETLSHSPVRRLSGQRPRWLLASRQYFEWLSLSEKWSLDKWDVPVMCNCFYLCICCWLHCLVQLIKGHACINVMELWLYLGIAILFVNVKF